ncbi:MAG TPA: hypothetical protein VFF94_06075, partial [Novosphingobium sp.]|nr:hypothetical protein [Novosphingobium sp.]
NDRCARRLPADLDARLTLFAQAVEEALAQEAWDEVLLVAHSQGAVWAVEVLARVLARRGGALPAGFALVTLGGCIPLLAARRDAAGFAAALARVRAADPAWLDLASPADGACAGLMPPGSAPPPPRFTQRNPRWYRYAATRGGQDRLAVHFNYLRRLDRPSPLDYPALALAAQPLAASIAAFDAAHAG